jgi:Mg-chelatase subunit ChlD
MLVACGSAPTAPTAAPKAADPARPAPAAPTKPAAWPGPPAPPAERGSATKPGTGALGHPAAVATSAPAAARGPGAPAPGARHGAGEATDAAAHPCTTCPPPPYRPTPAAEPPHQRLAEPLRAGAVDDNQRFDAYLHYLRAYRGPAAWPVDVSERYLITVTDQDQRPVANSVVRVYHGQQEVFTGRTYADGRTLFHPLAIPDAVQATAFTVTAEKDGRFVAQRFARGDGGQWTLALDGRPARAALVKLDLVFLIDSTGSMGGEIAKIQATLVSIADRIAQLGGQPQIRYAGVTYRDRGDQYVVRHVGFTDDLHEFQRWLNGIRAGGGGDYPESLNEALHVAVNQLDWDAGDAVRLVFLVADAPPHLDYPHDFRYTTEAAQAALKGIKLYTIGASGLNAQGEYVFRQLAQQTLAQFIFITRGGDARSGGGPVSATNIQAAEHNLDDVVVRIVAQELRLLT